MLIGEESVGKSSILSCYTDEKMASEYYPTLGIDYKNKILCMNNKKIKLFLYDTSGSSIFRFESCMVKFKLNAVIIVFDKSNRETFEKLNAWIDAIHQDIWNNTAKILVGNKCDLISEVSMDEVVEMYLRYGFSYIETSIQIKDSVQLMFDVILRLAFDRLLVS